jgi:hypothetical protein
MEDLSIPVDEYKPIEEPLEELWGHSETLRREHRVIGQGNRF